MRSIETAKVRSGRASTHLDSEIQEGEVPRTAGDDVFVDDGHANGRDAVRDHGDGAIVDDVGERLRHA